MDSTASNDCITVRMMASRSYTLMCGP